MKCIFVSNALAEEFVSKNNISTISYADNMAQLHLIKRLNEVYKKDLIVITAAYNDFTSFKHNEEITYDNDIKLIGIKNNSKNKIIYYVTLIIGYYRKICFFLKKYKNEKIVIITNGPHIFRTMPVVLAKKKYKFKFIPFLLASVELPEFKGIMKLITGYSKRALKYADGSINYVATNSIEFTRKPYVSILYSLSEEDKEMSNSIYKGSKKRKDVKDILFAGALNDINAAKDLLEIIKKAPVNYRFLICGDGIYQEKFAVLASKMPKKIIFFGKVSHQKVVELEHSSDFLILLRDTKTEIGKHHSKYSMSSKLTEYLLSGTPIIVNEHEAIPTEFRKYLNIVNNTDAMTIIEFLENSNFDEEKIIKKAISGRKYVIKNADYKVQGDKVIEFLNKI